MTGFIIIIAVLTLLLIASWTTISYKIKAGQLGLSISWGQAFGQQLRRTLTNDLLEAASLAAKANLSIEIMQLEAHKLAGGDPLKVVREIIDAKQRGEPLDYNMATAIDLGGDEVRKELTRKKD